MVRTSGKNADYYSSNDFNYFQLKDHGDSAKVRFMYDSLEDLELDIVHSVKIDDRDKYVDCLRTYDQPLDVCPFCQNGFKQYARLFIQLFDINTNQVLMWDRGKTMYKDLEVDLRNVQGALCSNIVEIIRKGDTKTSYKIDPISYDNTRLMDLPEEVDLRGKHILIKSAEDMLEYIQFGEFPKVEEEQSGQSSEPIRRQMPANNQQYQRRSDVNTTQTNSNGNMQNELNQVANQNVNIPAQPQTVQQPTQINQEQVQQPTQQPIQQSAQQPVQQSAQPTQVNQEQQVQQSINQPINQAQNAPDNNYMRNNVNQQF